MTFNNNLICLRMDDVGASSKYYEVYSKLPFGVGNILFLKYLPFIKAWGRYEEMAVSDWIDIIELLIKYNAKLTVAITASWVNKNGELIPFYDKFPQQLEQIRVGLDLGVLEIANHGLTHCVIQKKNFLPKLFSSNRKYHREFWDWIPKDIHFEHMEKSQEILRHSFEILPQVFIPPGNVFCNHTLDAAIKNGIKYVNCNTLSKTYKNLRIISNQNVEAFHDKDIVEQGPNFLSELLSCYDFFSPAYKFVSEL